MNILVGVEHLVRLMALAWVDARRLNVSWPVAVMFGVHCVLLMIAADPTHPLWSWALVPIFRLRFGDLYLHYPDALLGLPTTGAGLRIVLDLLLGPLVAAWVIVASMGTARGRRVDSSYLRAASLGAYPRIFLVFLALAALWTAMYSFPLQVVLREITLSHRLRILLTHGWGLVAALALVPLVFLIPSLLSGTTNWARAASDSLKLVRTNLMVAIGLGMLPYLVGVPFVLALNRSAAIALKLRPEFVLAIMIVQSMVALVVGFFVMNATARLWVGRKPTRMEASS